jgi:hypothetical protein
LHHHHQGGVLPEPSDYSSAIESCRPNQDWRLAVKLVKEMEQQLMLGVCGGSGGGGGSSAAAAATDGDDEKVEGNGSSGSVHSSDGHGAVCAASSSVNSNNTSLPLPRLLTALPLQPFTVLAECRLFACSTAIAICAQVVVDVFWLRGLFRYFRSTLIPIDPWSFFCVFVRSFVCMLCPNGQLAHHHASPPKKLTPPLLTISKPLIYILSHAAFS